MILQLFAEFSYYLFNGCKICSDISYFISDIGDLCLLFSSNLVKVSPILLIFFIKPAFSYFLYCFPVFISLISVLRTKNFTICMETQKTLNSQSNLENEKWSWRNQTPWLQTILQSYSNQDSMVLAQKQKYTSMEQDRKPRDKPTHLWSTNLWQRRQGNTMEKRQSLQ